MLVTTFVLLIIIFDIHSFHIVLLANDRWFAKASFGPRLTILKIWTRYISVQTILLYVYIHSISSNVILALSVSAFYKTFWTPTLASKSNSDISIPQSSWATNETKLATNTAFRFGNSHWTAACHFSNLHVRSPEYVSMAKVKGKMVPVCPR